MGLLFGQPTHMLVVSSALPVASRATLSLATAPPTNATDEPEFANMVQLLATSLAVVLVLILFGVAIYLVLRLGRRVRETEVGGARSEYQDAWSAYRLSDDDVSAATAEQRDDDPDAEK